MANTFRRGKVGEQAAIDFLIAKGHQILEINFRRMHKEIDIISKEGVVLVFTEVKTRSNFDFGYPEEAVDLQKQEHIKTVASIFLSENEHINKLDLISLVFY